MHSRSCSSASGGPERQHDDLAALRLDDPHRLLDAALLVRPDREPEVPRLDRLRVVREHHPPAGDRDALDADEDPHAADPRVLGVEDRRRAVRSPTVTGYCSPRYSTSELLADVRALGRQVGEQDVLADRRPGARARHVRAAALARRRAARRRRVAPARVRACSASTRSTRCGRRRSACRGPPPAPPRAAARCASLPTKSASFTFGPTPCRPRRRRSRRRARTPNAR